MAFNDSNNVLFENEMIKDCFLFLLENELNKEMVENFIYNQLRNLKNIKQYKFNVCVFGEEL